MLLELGVSEKKKRNFQQNYIFSGQNVFMFEQFYSQTAHSCFQETTFLIFGRHYTCCIEQFSLALLSYLAIRLHKKSMGLFHGATHFYDEKRTQA